MILIDKISFKQTEDDYHTVIHHTRPYDPIRITTEEGYPSHASAMEIQQEVVNSVHFRRPDGEDIFVGYSEQAAKVLGLSYEVFDNQNKIIEEERCYSAYLKRELNKVKSERDELAGKVSGMRKLIRCILDREDKLKKRTFWDYLKGLFV